MSLVLDIQCFKIENNKYVVKELAGYDGNRILHVVFKPPFPFDMLSPHFQKQANWLIKNHHSIEWGTGSTPVHLFGNILQDILSQADRVYIKGKEKADYIRKFTSKLVVELPEQPALEKNLPKCFYHSKSYCMCALTNVFFLYDNCIMT